MDPKETEKLEEEFHVSKFIVAYKFILGLLEFLLGLAIIFFGRNALILYQNFKSDELLEDPHDLLVNITEKFVPYLFKHKEYVIFILIILGLTKMIGAIGLMYKKTWGLDLLLGVTILILPFQLFSFLRNPSLFDLIYLLIGVFIIFWLVNFKPKEYIHKFKRRIQKNNNASGST